MKPLIILLLFVCLSYISYADTDVAFSEDYFSTESLQKLYETLESSELSTHPVQLTSLPRQSTVTVINDYADALITKVQGGIVEKGLDTITIPDVNLSFKNKIALITYSGLLYLTEGTVTSVSSIKRTGDVVASYSNKYLTLQVPLDFETLNVNYHYKAEIMNIGPTGTVIGKASSSTFNVAVGLNFTDYVVDLNEFTVNDIDDIKLGFNGNSLIDWLLNIITNLLVPLFKTTIRKVVEENVYGVVVNVVETANEALSGLRQ